MNNPDVPAMADALVRLVRDGRWADAYPMAVAIGLETQRRAAAVGADGVVELQPAPPPARPTKAQVLESRKGGGGCCNRYADYSGCTCFRDAVGPCPLCNDSGYEVHPRNGRNGAGRRCRMGCEVRCSVCYDRDCDNPGGQH